MKILVLPFILLIKLYQKTLSTWINMFTGPKCKYYPSCSHYAVDALETHNLAGLPLIAWRLIRCNPFSHGGVDYVSNNYLENYLKNPQIQSKFNSSGVN
ncbi:MAG: membrane protein insertion efficiency factor YidD [Candidatus Nanopelagicaceae bacterium]